MKALDRKALRDLRTMWAQALTIALVVASGVAGFLATQSGVATLEQAREGFYAEGRFADLFAAVKRAPRALQAPLRELPGVAEVQTTAEVGVRVTLPGVADAVVGQLIGVPRREPLRLNRITLRDARGGPDAAHPAWPGAASSDGTLPAWVSEAFATAHGLRPGAQLSVLLNGRQRSLRVMGVALSPEYIFAGLWGMPDQRGFGVFWVDAEALEAAADLHGAFNRVALRLAPGADARATTDALQRLLAPYGGRDAHGRDAQASHAMLDNEIQEQRVLGSMLPAIFLAVAAFLLNVVVSRLVATQREQVAALKALGYANAAIAAHYLKLVGVIVAFGLLLGVVLGRGLGALLAGLYAESFRFPRFDTVMPPALVLLALLLTVATAAAGALAAVADTVRLAPAEAMRPPAPGLYRRTLLERLGLRRLPVVLRMVLRGMERRPWRTALSTGGVAAAVAIIVLGRFFGDAIGLIVDNQFQQVMRNDIAVWSTEPVPEAARRELLRLDGVLAAESTRFVPVRLLHGQRSERCLIRGYAEQPELYRIVDIEGRAVAPPDDGLVLTDRLADKLGVRAGDLLQVQVLEGRERTLVLPVTATVHEMMGLNAYMTRAGLNRALGDGDVATGFVLALRRGSEPAVLEATRALPRSAGVFSKATMLRNMQDISARNIRIMSGVLTAFAAVIAVGVVYNNARIALSERSWELASLRVLGFTRAEVSAVLLGEQALTVALALPLGWALGLALVHGLAAALRSDAFAFPVVVLPGSYAWAALCVLAAAAATAALVRRRIDRLDMVAALKARE